MKVFFKKAVIVGPGLIGGSIGVNLRQRRLAADVVGVARHAATLAEAKKKKAIDSGTADVRAAVNGADMVILAVPVRSIQTILKQIRDILSPGCLVFDVGSTKREIVSLAEKVLPSGVHFVGTHPMAGSEKAGARFADAGLFRNTLCFITKTASTDAAALARIKKLWETFGAATVVIAPAEHDRIVAQVSHLPHLVSVALVESVRNDFLCFGASGLRDMTRIAAGDPSMWRDISLSNNRELVKALTVFEKQLALIKRLVRQGDERRLMRVFEQAKKKRETVRL